MTRCTSQGSAILSDMAEPLLRPRVDLADDPFRYGWRIGADLGYVPLAPDDFLDPQPGDQMVQGDTHAWLVFDLADRLKRRYESSPDIAVFTDLKMIWGIPGLSEPAPDVAVVKGIRDKDEERSSFYAPREGILPALVVEVVSPVHPALRSRDLRHKVEIYQQAGVLEYLIVDLEPTGRRGSIDLLGYKLDAKGHYQPIRRGRGGRILSETTGLYWSPKWETFGVRLEDEATGQFLLSSSEEAEARHQEALARQQAERREAEAMAEIARLRAELEQLRGPR